jgi:DNA-directed RNA polymerase subunit D
MQIELIEKIDGDRKAVLRLKKATTQLVNALRRSVLLSLPAFAIDEVDIYENNSPFFSEYLANRLGLVPLTYDSSVPADSKISMTLSAEGPCTVYSKDLVSSESKVSPSNANFPIAELAAGQKLRLEAFAVLGKASKHAKYQCAHASFMIYPQIELKKNSPKVKEFLSKLPKSMFFEDGEIKPHKSDALIWFIEENPDLGSYESKEGDFVFQVESYNNVPALVHLQTALELLKNDSTEFRKLLKEA